MRRRPKTTKAGFTLVEFSFAIAFISVLLITITLITNEIVSVYRKGYSIKKINQIGRDIIDDFQNSITQSPPTLISSFCDRVYGSGVLSTNCKKNNGFYSVYQQFYKKVTVDNDEENPGAHYLPMNGIFCSGKYTYIWNTGYLFNKDSVYSLGATKEDLRLKLDYKVIGLADDATPYKDGNFHLLKIEDSGRKICQNTVESAYPDPSFVQIATVNHTITVPFSLPEVPEEMLKGDDGSFILYDLVFFEPARIPTSNRLLFSGSFVLGSTIGAVDIMSSSNYCKAPSNFSADFSYCAINKFNFSIQASGMN